MDTKKGNGGGNGADVKTDKNGYRYDGSMVVPPSKGGKSGFNYDMSLVVPPALKNSPDESKKGK
jgi:hypothetical protein